MRNLKKILMLLVSGAKFIFSGFSLVSFTSFGDAGWVQVTNPHAFYYGGYTYIGWVDTNGDIDVSYIPDGGSMGNITVLAASFQDDIHAAPSIWVIEPSHKLLVILFAHNGGGWNRYISNNSLDSDATLSGGFTGANRDFQVGGTSYTYPSIGQLTDEVNNPIYVTFREGNASTGALAITKSINGGIDWSAETLLVSQSGVGHYWIAHFGTNRIDFAVSNGNGAGDSNVDIFHFYYAGGAYYKSDGTALGSPPFTTANLTKVYDTGTGTGWANGMAIDSNGNPIIITQTLDAPLGTVLTIRYHKWNGTSWITTTISTVTGLDYYGNSCIDEDNIDIVWRSSYVNGVLEIFYCTTVDGGITWQCNQLTSNSAYDNSYVVNIHNSGNDLKAFWNYGYFKHSTTVFGNTNMTIIGARTQH